MLYGVFVFSGSSEYISYSSVYEVQIGPFRSINSFHLILKLEISTVHFLGMSNYLFEFSSFNDFAFLSSIISTRHTWV